jgi:predicted outer membrane protein
MHQTAFVRTTLLAGLTFALGALAAACASDQKPAATAEEVRDGEALPPAPPVPAEPASTDSPTAPTVPGGSAAATPTPLSVPEKELLSEAQIAKVSELVNSAEVEQGKLAQGRAKAANVKLFAGMMVKHHGEALAEQAKLVKKLKLTPADSVTAGKLKTDADQTLASLKSSDAAGFDAAYVASQVEAHQMVLRLIDEQLLPAAKTAEVTDTLRRARTVVAEHLDQAKALQAK